MPVPRSLPRPECYLRPNACRFFCFLESQKDESDLNEEQEILSAMMQVIEQRDRLVDSLEEQRIKEKAEDQHFESFVFSRGCQLSRT